MGGTRVEPEFIRRLLLLERCLKGTPDEYLKEDFKPHVQALRIILSGNEEAYGRNLEECRQRLEDGFAEIAPYAADGFPDAVRALSTFLNTFAESKDLVRNMDLALKRDKEMLQVHAGDVHALYYRSVRLTESINILDRVEYTTGVLKSVDGLLAEGKTYQAVDLLVRGHNIAASTQLARIQALEVIRDEISRRRRTLFEEITEELIKLVYSGHPLVESKESQGPRLSSQARLKELVDSLQALKDEQTVVSTIKKKTPLALEHLILQSLAASWHEDRAMYDEAPRGLTRFASVDGASAAVGILEVLSGILPSAQAPNHSKILCESILNRSRAAFADAVENHSILLTKVSAAAAKELSLAGLLHNMQQKLIELVNVLIGSVTLTAKDAFRKQLARNGKAKFFAVDSSSLHFSFLPQPQTTEKLSETTTSASIVEVVNSMRSPALVLSRYNIPGLRHSLLRKVQSGARNVLETTSTLLASYADDLVTRELMTKLRSDLDSYIDCLAGNVTSLINMEGTVVEDNASLPTLPAVLGVEKVIEEVVSLACATASHPAAFAAQLGQFLGAFRTRCWLALTAAESWTAAGTLLTDATFIGEMQSRMQMFELQAAAVRRDTAGGKRAPVMPDLEVDAQRDRAKFAALQNALDSMHPSERITLSTVELKAVVRFIASLYLIFRKLENPSSFGSQTSDLEQSSAQKNPLQKEKDKQRLQATQKVTNRLLEAQAGETGRLLEVADKGVMLLRIDMQAKVYLKLLELLQLLCVSKFGQSEAELLGMQLGKQLVDFERVVKFNLDVTKREYMFNDIDSVFAMFLERIHVKLQQHSALTPNAAVALGHFVSGTQKKYQLLNERSDSSTLRALTEIDKASAL